MNRGDHSICMKIEQGLQSDQVIIQLPCACTRVFTLRVSVCHLWMNCSSAESCECNPERRIHQYPRRQRNANRVYPMWRGERKVLATIVGIVVARNTTRLDGVQLKPISDKVLHSRKNGPGTPVSTQSQIVKGYAHHVPTFVKGYAHHVPSKVVSLIGSHSQRISQYTLLQ